ncbi:MAG: hypothetical protein ACR2IH_08695 [Pyrinomonadaceae bacterium]
MNCAYHSHNPAGVNCNGCGKPLCAACDHRIKGFPYCQDCIVRGVDLLRKQKQTNHVPFVTKRTSPFVATFFSLVCPGLGAAYNGQTIKALVYFAVFVGLFQLAILTGGTLIFVLGFMGMWFFAALDAWRTAQMIRAGLTPNTADDILVKRFAGNPKLWGVVLTVLGAAFLLQSAFNLRGLMRGLLPVMLIGLGVYILRGYIFKRPEKEEVYVREYGSSQPSPMFANSLSEQRYSPQDSAETHVTYRRDKGFGGWRNQ